MAVEPGGDLPGRASMAFDNVNVNRTAVQPAVKPATGVTTTVIVPAYNEAAAMPQVLDELHATLDERYEIVVVDDGSTDNTADIADRFPCRVIRHSSRQGK